MSAYANEQERANVRRHWLGVAVIGVLAKHDQVANLLDGDTFNRLVDQIIADPEEATVAALLVSDFDGGFGLYRLGDWFSSADAGAFASRVVTALESAEGSLS